MNIEFTESFPPELLVILDSIDKCQSREKALFELNKFPSCIIEPLEKTMIYVYADFIHRYGQVMYHTLWGRVCFTNISMYRMSDWIK